MSEDLVAAGKIARDEAANIQELISETRDTIRGQIVEIREMVVDTVDEARDIVMQPVREYSAIAAAIAAGVRTFFGRKKPIETPLESENEFPQERQPPAAPAGSRAPAA